ncbi:MAG TPA: peptidyl-prolyl cis-trans isomerase [Candidatus Aphodousia faecalis]|uniref:peptidylprolyl isomerase n=1 Tax=Parasutterella secunda TaxID=626947 RepID=UPI001F908229|nr:peptidyl-prolyl cis-trans isomerase [Candidatus Aphodousia faecalis]
MTSFTRRAAVVALAMAAFVPAAFAAQATQVKVDTNMGAFVIELNAKAAPKTVENFLAYVKSGFYKNTLFHRVIPNFMIQGGGFVMGMEEKDTRAPIALESRNGLSNVRGTIAMARTNDPNSATSQFFINVRDNRFLDANQAQDGNGYAVFGKVVSGMSTVDAIARVKTHSVGYYDDVPIRDVVIKNMSVIKGK